ncbi:MAG TPA: hypothetical protein VHM28_05040 [Anaerolineales bacterium]|jgi:hypothetical protein|nr:hypothetical protein [Anaerolineales bacterium]
MSRNIILLIASVLSFVFGLVFLFAPTALMNLYGISLDPTGEWLTRYMGSAFLSIGVLNWLVRGMQDGSSHAILIADFTFSAVGLVVTLLARISGLGNALLWVTIAGYVLLTIGFAYYTFVPTAQK